MLLARYRSGAIAAKWIRGVALQITVTVADSLLQLSQCPQLNLFRCNDALYGVDLIVAETPKLINQLNVELDQK